jgi:hypothetical protein
MSIFTSRPRLQPLQLRQGLLCGIAQVTASWTAKVRRQIAKVALHDSEGDCAEVQKNLGENATMVLRIGKPASVSSMSVFGGLLKECHQEVSSSKSPCLPVEEGNR